MQKKIFIWRYGDGRWPLKTYDLIPLSYLSLRELWRKKTIQHQFLIWCMKLCVYSRRKNHNLVKLLVKILQTTENPWNNTNYYVILLKIFKLCIKTCFKLKQIVCYNKNIYKITQCKNSVFPIKMLKIFNIQL